MKRQTIPAGILGTLMLLLCPAAYSEPVLEKTSAPQVEIGPVRRAFHDGHHNAFTDLCRFRDKIYLTFRTCPDGHGVHPTSSILILSSSDGVAWEEVLRFSVPKRDTRDPHFLIFKDKLFVYTGTWHCGDGPPKKWELNDHLGYAVYSANGRDWQGPVLLEGTYGHYIWRAATDGESAFLCARRKVDFAASGSAEPPEIESALLESSDGLIWKLRDFFQREKGDETAFLIEDDGTLLALSRTHGNEDAQLARSRPPYHDWERKHLDRAVGGPLLAKWQGHYLVGGRNTSGKQAYTSLGWLIGDRFQEIAKLPSAGDNSYPGFVPLDEKRGLVSYYSSHEKDESGKPITAIYLTELTLSE